MPLLDALRLVPAAPPGRGTLEDEAGDQGSSRGMRASGRGSSVWSGPPRSRELPAEDESRRPSEAGDEGRRARQAARAVSMLRGGSWKASKPCAPRSLQGRAQTALELDSGSDHCFKRQVCLTGEAPHV